MRHLKEEFDKLSMKDFLTFLVAIGCQIAAVVAIFLSLYIEPEGEIHSSVLAYFGISSGFCGSLLGLSIRYKSQLAEFKTEAMRDVNDRLGNLEKNAFDKNINAVSS